MGLSFIWLLANVCTLLQMYKALRCAFLCMSSCLTWAGFALKVLPFGSKWTLGPHAPFQRDKHSHMLKNSPYSSTQPSTRSRQPRLITFPCLWGFFPFISLSLILPKVFFLLSVGSVLANPIKPLYHTTALMDPIRAAQREPDSQSELQPETCVLLCGERQKRWSEGEIKRGIWRAEWAEICPGARPSTMRNICLTSGRLPRQTPHPCQEW